MKESPHPAQAQNVPTVTKKRKTQTNRLSSQGLVVLLTSTFRIRTSHVSSRLRVIPGTTCPGLYGSRRLPLPDPCSPMTNNASLPTLFSPKPLDDTEEPLSDRQAFSSAIMCRPIKAHDFTVSTGMLGPNRTNSEKTNSPCGPYHPGTFHCVQVLRRRTLSHASRKGHRTSSHNGQVGHCDIMRRK